MSDYCTGRAGNPLCPGCDYCLGSEGGPVPEGYEWVRQQAEERERVMSASRKLYREIAESIRTNMVGMTPKQAEGAAMIARAVASDLKRDNYNFRYDTFFEAAGLDYMGLPIKVKKARNV